MIMGGSSEASGIRKRKKGRTRDIERGLSIEQSNTVTPAVDAESENQGGRVNQNCQFPNTRCNPERFCELVKFMDEHHKVWVQQMGFGDLLRLSIRKVDRYLCLWLMRKFDPDQKRLMVRDDNWVDVEYNDVGWVLGIPGPNRPVPTDIPNELLLDFKHKFYNRKGIEEKALFEMLISPDTGEHEFKQAFLLYTLGVLLCPTQSCKISPMHLKVLHTALSANNYNWCQYVFKWLLVSARKFKVSKSVVGGYGGCALFLMVFYIDRINMGNPVNWSLTNCRVDAWEAEMVLLAIEKDRKSRSEFGNAEFVPNVRYGNKYPIGRTIIRWEEVRLQSLAVAKLNNVETEIEEAVKGLTKPSHSEPELK